MPVSGTTTFSTTRDELLQDVFDCMAVTQDGQTIDAGMIAKGSRSLNMLIKAMAAKGIPIWAIQTTPIPLVVAQGSYTIGPSGANITDNRPIRIYQAYIQDSNSNSWPMEQISKQAYDFLSRKATPGIPNQFYYAPLLDKGQLNIYPVINQTGYTIYASCQRQLFDMTNGTDTFDFPQDMYLMLKWVTARDLLSMYAVPAEIRQEVKENAERWENPSWDFEQEEASTTFAPVMGQGGWDVNR